MDVLNEVGLVVGEEEGGELGREEADLLADVGRGNKDSVDSVDDTVLGFLQSISPDQVVEVRCDTHKVNGNDLAVQVDPHTRESDTSSKTLRLITEQLLLQRSRNCVGEKNS